MKAKNYKKQVVTLTKSVAIFLSQFDVIMKEKSGVERGKKLAKLCNFLEMENDKTMRFGLGYGWIKIKNIKKRMI